MQAPLDGSLWDGEECGDLAQRPALDVMEGKESPVVQPQVLEGPPNRVRLAHRRRERRPVGIANGDGSGSLLRLDIDLADLDPVAAAEPVSTRVHEDPSQPGIELLRVSEPGEMLPGGDECVLGCVMRIGFGTQDGERRPVQPTAPGSDERVESDVVAASGPLDDGSVNGSNRPHHIDARVRHGYPTHRPNEQMTFQGTPGLGFVRHQR